MSQPKYSLLEIERRWIVPWAVAQSLPLPSPARITDLYLEGTRLRLRCVEREGQKPVWKLCLKYEPLEQGVQPITNLYLTPEEADLIAKVPGKRIEKLRHPWAEGSLDLIPSLQVAIYEKEFESKEAADLYVRPNQCGEEVTGLEAWSGASLAEQSQGPPFSVEGRPLAGDTG